MYKIYIVYRSIWPKLRFVLLRDVTIYVVWEVATQRSPFNGGDIN